MATPRPVHVIADSTADIPSELAAPLGITTVPLTVTFGDRSFLDRVEIDPATFLTELRAAPDLPKTSQPPTTAFEEAFRGAVEAGADVVCVTLAAGISGTHNAARLAAEAVDPDRVRVLDSRVASMGFGWVVVEAARAAQAGADLEGVVAAAESAIDRSRLYAVLQTLEYVHRGGRIGRASHLVGSMLSIKPIITIRDEVIPVERVRTWRKALGRMAELAAGHAPLAAAAVLHVGNLDDAHVLADRLAPLVPDNDVLITEAGPVIATYAGPGAVGVAILSAE